MWYSEADAVEMGQAWTAAMEAQLGEELAKTASEAEVELPASATAITGETLLVRDVLRGLALHLVDVMRHRLLRGQPPVWGLAERIDQSRCFRELAEPVDPELAKRLEEDLDIFEGMALYNA